MCEPICASTDKLGFSFSRADIPSRTTYTHFHHIPGETREAFDTWLERRMASSEPEESVYYAVMCETNAGVSGLIHATVNRSAGVLTVATTDLCNRGDLMLVETLFLFSR